MSNGTDAGEQKRMVSFTKKRNRTKMDPSSARRQGNIVSVALASLGNADAAMEFLNGVHPTLGSRPLDVATQSQAGFDEVRLLLGQD